eukprot:SAG22_NODE_8370_length_661_cov_0.738434_1_plen_79_part_01
MRVVVTGASTELGRAVCEHAARAGHTVVPSCRPGQHSHADEVQCALSHPGDPDCGGGVDIDELVVGADRIVYLDAFLAG